MKTVGKKRKLKNLQKYTHVAKIEIKAGSGMLIEGNSHIDFWMFDTFDPIASIVHVDELSHWLNLVKKRQFCLKSLNTWTDLRQSCWIVALRLRL